MPAAVAFGLATPVAAATLSAFGLAPLAALLVAAIVTGAAAVMLRERLAAALALPRLPPMGAAMLAIVALFAAIRLWTMSIYMMDPAHAGLSVLWFDPFYIRHNCFTAWFQGAVFAVQRVPNVYLNAMYDGFIGRFSLDDLLYPSPFLLLPRLGLVFSRHFYTLRAAWFALEAALFFGAVVVVARWAGGEEGRRALWLTPALVLSTPVLLTLQIGNFQLAALALAMLALVAFDNERPVPGGALLGFALFKLFPGIVLVPLVIRRRWRDLAWTAAFSVLYTAASILWMGTAPFVQFFRYQLPRITSGSAWDWLELPEMAKVVAINQSIPGFALKLHQLGLVSAVHRDVRMLSLVYTLVVVAIAVLVGTRMADADRLTKAQLWIALLGLAALRSPFVPDTYALTPVLWLWSLTVPQLWSRSAAFAGALLLWIPLATVLPFDGPFAPDGRLRLFLGLAVQAIAVTFTAFTFLPRARRRAVQLIQETA